MHVTTRNKLFDVVNLLQVFEIVDVFFTGADKGRHMIKSIKASECFES